MKKLNTGLTLTVTSMNKTGKILEDQGTTAWTRLFLTWFQAHLQSCLKRHQASITGFEHSPTYWRAEPSVPPKETGTAWSSSSGCSSVLVSSSVFWIGSAWTWKASRTRAERRTSVFMAGSHLEDWWAGAQCVESEYPACIYRTEKGLHLEKALFDGKLERLLTSSSLWCSFVLKAATIVLHCVFCDKTPLIMMKGPCSLLPFPICLSIYLLFVREENSWALPNLISSRNKRFLCSGLGACTSQKVWIRPWPGRLESQFFAWFRYYQSSSWGVTLWTPYLRPL